MLGYRNHEIRTCLAGYKIIAFIFLGTWEHCKPNISQTLSISKRCSVCDSDSIFSLLLTGYLGTQSTYIHRWSQTLPKRKYDKIQTWKPGQEGGHLPFHSKYIRITFIHQLNRYLFWQFSWFRNVRTNRETKISTWKSAAPCMLAQENPLRLLRRRGEHSIIIRGNYIKIKVSSAKRLW